MAAQRRSSAKRFLRSMPPVPVSMGRYPFGSRAANWAGGCNLGASIIETEAQLSFMTTFSKRSLTPSGERPGQTLPHYQGLPSRRQSWQLSGASIP